MMPCLAIAALAGAVSCTDAPVAPRTNESLALTVAPATDSVTLTYICGNMFRVRNAAFEPRDVRWDIYNAVPADTGSLRLRGRDAGATYVDYFVTSRTKGTMRVFAGGVLRQTKANGNKVACAAPVDTSAIPRVSTRWFGLATEPHAKDRDSLIVARTVLSIFFDPNTTSPAALRGLLSSLNAQIVRVLEPGFLYLRIPDPGTNADTLDAIERRIKLSPFVQRAAFVLLEVRWGTSGARYPNDGPNSRRGDQISGNSGAWPARAMRLNAGWWCETGGYSATAARIAIMEASFPDTVPADLIQNVRLVQTAADTGSMYSASTASYNRAHGIAVAGMAAAQGDNGIGIAGVLWRTSVDLYSLNQQGKGTRRSVEFFEQTIVPQIIANQTRVLSLSSDFSADPSGSADKRYALQRAAYVALKYLLDQNSNLLVVKSAGNDSYSGAFDASPAHVQTGFLAAISTLKADPTYADRIVLVGATNKSGNRWTRSNAFAGLVDVYAPGEAVPVLRANGNLDYDSGTSFSTPLVAGIAGQLLTMDPSLSAADVKALLLAGARDSVEGPDGINRLPDKVGNTTDVVYEADAYGSLRLLSARAGTPLCGAQMMPWGNPVTYPDAYFNRAPGVRAVRYGGATETFPGTARSVQALAPGGRLLAFAPSFFQQFAGPSWTTTQTYTDGYRRIFGERDTLAYRLDPPTGAGFFNLRIRKLATAQQWDVRAALGTQLEAGREYTFGPPAMDPDGQRVLIPLRREHLVALDTSANLHYLAVLRDSGATLLPTTMAGFRTGEDGTTAWDPTGSKAIMYKMGTLAQAADSFASAIFLVSFSGNNAGQVAPLKIEVNRWPFFVSWSDEGQRLALIDGRFENLNGFSTPLVDCRLRMFHLTAANALVLLSTKPLDISVCAFANFFDSPFDDYVRRRDALGNGGGGGGGDGGGGDGGGTFDGRVLRLPAPRSRQPALQAACRAGGIITRSALCKLHSRPGTQTPSF
jgi:Subtilase family